MNKTNVYNPLNLPSRILSGEVWGTDFDQMAYVYTTDGAKPQQVVIADGQTNSTDYYEPLVFENGELKKNRHNYGQLRDMSGEFESVFHIVDHLSNSRVWISDLNGDGHIDCEEEILQVKPARPLSRFTPSKVPQTFGFAAFDHTAKLHCVNPFGMPHDLPEEADLPTLPYRDSDPFTYNDKEYEDRVKKMYDYHARWYDASLGRWGVVDPMAHLREWVSPYNFVQNNPINRIDPTGALDVDITAKQDGTIEVKKTDDKFDRIFVENKQGETELVGQYDKNENGLIQLPSKVDFNSSDPNSSFSVGIKPGQESRSYLSGKSIAALFGAASQANISDLTITRGSHPDGRSPGNSTSHVNGINFDLRYLRTDKSGGPLDISRTPNLLDESRQNSFNDALYKFGYKDLIGFKYNSGGQTKLLNHTRQLSNHHHHLHLQGFKPKLSIIK